MTTGPSEMMKAWMTAHYGGPCSDPDDCKDVLKAEERTPRIFEGREPAFLARNAIRHQSDRDRHDDDDVL